jgi:long-chain acyl-CoA synthetase
MSNAKQGNGSLAMGSLRSALAAHGVRPRAVVVVYASVPAVAALAFETTFGLQGTVAVLDARLPLRGLAEIVAELAPCVILCDAEARATVERVETRACILEISPEPGHEASLLRPPQLPALRAPGLHEDAALLVYTSGSSGQRRGVMLSGDNVEFVTGAIQQRLRYDAGDIVGVFVPLAFDYGLYQLLLARRVGCQIYLGESLVTGSDLVQRLEEHQISVLPAVPRLVLMLLQILRARPRALPHLRMITSTGEHLPPEWVNELRGLLPHTEIFPMYGLTECKRVSILTPEEFPFRPTSVGRPLDGTDVYAVDEQRRRLPSGVSGELVVTGRHVGLGYFNAPDDTARRFSGSEPSSRLLFTGDRGHVDAEGYVYVDGRRDGLFKHKGARMSAREVELAAEQIRGVEVAVLVRYADRPLLKLVVQGKDITPQSVRAGLRAVLEPYKLPDEIDCVEELPRTLNGKIDRQRLHGKEPSDSPPHDTHGPSRSSHA